MSAWHVIRVVLVVVGLIVKFAILGKGCDSRSSYRYNSSYTPDYSSPYNSTGTDYSGLAGHTPAERVELPGMSIYAPNGTTATITGDRAEGNAKPQSESDLWSVTWAEDGGLGPQAALELITSVTNSKETFHAGEIRDAVIGGLDGKQLTLSDGSSDQGIIVSAVTCTGRIVMIHAGAYDGSQAASDAMTSTFECDPLPPPQGPRFAEKKGWESDGATTPGYSNAHDVYVSSWGMSGSLEDDAYGVIAASTAFEGFTPTSEKPTKKGGKYTWTGMYERDDTKRPGVVTAWQCSDLRIAITTVSSPSRKYVAEGQALAATAKCN